MRRRERKMMTMITVKMTTTMMTTAPGGHCLIAHIMIWMSLPERKTNTHRK